MVREDKVCAWLQDEVLQRVVQPKRARGYRTKLSKAHTASVGAVDGDPGSVDAAQSSSESLGEEGEESTSKSLTYTTVKGYTNAIAELHRWQVSDGTNPWPTFRGPALQGLLTSL